MFINGNPVEIAAVQHRTIKGANVLKVKTDTDTLTFTREELEHMIEMLKMEPLATRRVD